MSGYLHSNDRGGCHAPSLYAQTAGELPDYPALSGSVRADVCVVGGGYAGLSAALHLAERGFGVVLLDAHRIGWGASGRNGGQLGSGPRADIRQYERLVGRDDAQKVWSIAMAANRLVRDLIARYDIACDLRNGVIDAAWRRRDLGDIHSFAEHCSQHYHHPAIRCMDQAALWDILDTRCYHGGALDEVAGHLHPLRLALGLGRAAVAGGVRINERSEVIRVSPGRVETAQGSVTADQIVLALNGYCDHLMPTLTRRVLPVNNFILATAPLDAQSLPIRGGYAVADSKFVLDYYRLTPDNRLVFGGGESYGRRFPRDIKSLVRRRMTRVFPQLYDAPITHAWGGTLGITVTRFPAFLRPSPDVLAIGGWSGSGIHMGVMGGRIAADAIAGQMEQWDVMARLPVPVFPGGDWLRAPLLMLAMTWYALRDRL